MLRALVFTATLLAASPALAITGSAYVIDGDTVVIQGEHIRLAGIDAPEKRQSCTDATGALYDCGIIARNALRTEIGSAPVDCEGTETDKYRRLIATCYLGALDLNRWMVDQGLAVAYRYFSMVYAPEEDAAHAAHRGIWAGAFQMPWDWRQEHH